MNFINCWYKLAVSLQCVRTYASLCNELKLDSKFVDSNFFACYEQHRFLHQKNNFSHYNASGKSTETNWQKNLNIVSSVGVSSLFSEVVHPQMQTRLLTEQAADAAPSWKKLTRLHRTQFCDDEKGATANFVFENCASHMYWEDTDKLCDPLGYR